MSVYGEGFYVMLDGWCVDNACCRISDIRNGRWNPLSSEGEPLSPLPTDEEKPVDLASIYALTKFA